MKEDELAVFVDSATHYFDTISDKSATVGAPFLIQDINKYLLEYTGIIGISGNHKGSIFFSAPERMLNHILTDLGVLSSTEERFKDIVGEVSNTLSGNARRQFGDLFMLSTPIVLKGKSSEISLTEIVNNYMIPITWRSMTAHLIIHLDAS